MDPAAPSPTTLAARIKIKAQGWLWKQGHIRKNWKRRWFVLRDAFLAYFEAPTKTNVEPLGVIPLIECELQENAVVVSGFQHSFIVNTTIGKSFLLRAEGASELMEWLIKIKQARTVHGVLAGARQPLPADLHERKRLVKRQWYEQQRKGQRHSRASMKVVGAGVSLPRPYFDVPLQELLLRERESKLHVPLWAERMCAALEAQPATPGLFRLSGGADAVEVLRLRLEGGDALELAGLDPHNVASLLKSWVRAIPGGLVPAHLHPLFVRAVADGPEQPPPAVFAPALAQLAKPNRALLARLLRLLATVAAHSDANHMTVANLAICWAPNIFRQADTTSPRAMAPGSISALKEDVLASIRDTSTLLHVTRVLISQYEQLFPPTSPPQQQPQPHSQPHPNPTASSSPQPLVLLGSASPTVRLSPQLSSPLNASLATSSPPLSNPGSSTGSAILSSSSGPVRVTARPGQQLSGGGESSSSPPASPQAVSPRALSPPVPTSPLPPRPLAKSWQLPLPRSSFDDDEQLPVSASASLLANLPGCDSSPLAAEPRTSPSDEVPRMASPPVPSKIWGSHRAPVSPLPAVPANRAPAASAAPAVVGMSKQRALTSNTSPIPSVGSTSLRESPKQTAQSAERKGSFIGRERRGTNPAGPMSGPTSPLSTSPPPSGRDWQPPAAAVVAPARAELVSGSMRRKATVAGPVEARFEPQSLSPNTRRPQDVLSDVDEFLRRIDEGPAGHSVRSSGGSGSGGSAHATPRAPT